MAYLAILGSFRQTITNEKFSGSYFKRPGKQKIKFSQLGWNFADNEIFCSFLALNSQILSKNQ